jgi:hypothetical protein
VIVREAQRGEVLEALKRYPSIDRAQQPGARKAGGGRPEAPLTTSNVPATWAVSVPSLFVKTIGPVNEAVVPTT